MPSLHNVCKGLLIGTCFQPIIFIHVDRFYRVVDLGCGKCDSCSVNYKNYFITGMIPTIHTYISSCDFGLDLDRVRWFRNALMRRSEVICGANGSIKTVLQGPSPASTKCSGLDANFPVSVAFSHLRQTSTESFIKSSLPVGEQTWKEFVLQFILTSF